MRHDDIGSRQPLYTQLLTHNLTLINSALIYGFFLDFENVDFLLLQIISNISGS